MLHWVADWNALEAVLWLILARLCAWKAARVPTAARRTWSLLALTLVVFAATDVIEMRTGAWWEPWWLAVLKGGCIAVLAICFRKLLRAPRPQISDANPTRNDPARK